MTWSIFFSPLLWGIFLLAVIQTVKIFWRKLRHLQQRAQAFLDRFEKVGTLYTRGETLLEALERAAAKIDSSGATDVESRLRKVEYDMAEMKAAMYDMLRDMKTLHKIAEEAINVHDDIGNEVIDTHYELATVIPELSRLSQLTKHRVDDQNFILQCVFYSLDEQFLLLCDLANIVEEAIDPTCPYPFTLRLAHRPRGQGPRPRNRQYY